MLTGTKLIEAVADQIEARPDQYDQGSWGYIVGAPSNVTLDIIEKMGANDCGTKGCIAGWAVALNATEKEVMETFKFKLLDIGSMAERLMGLGSHTADILFNEIWEPAAGYSVPDALRLLAKGSDIEDVTLDEVLDAFM